MRIRFATATLLLLASSVVAQEKVPDPEIERAAFKVADGFEVSLFAADPLIAKPIGMNFDSAGRLWVTSSSLYPQIRPGEVADDKIVVLEDKDGDGKAEAGKVLEGYVPEVWHLAMAGFMSGLRPSCCISKDTMAMAGRMCGGWCSRGWAGRNASHRPHPALGAGWTALFQSVDLHSQPY
jgi:hypothetical protein